MSTPLEDVVAAAEETAAEQRRIAQVARTMERHRTRGSSWAEVLDREDGANLVDLLRRSGRRIGDATAAFTHALAAELHAEGASHRTIARRLGVSHQRVSMMLDQQRRATSTSG
jgi:hypothetical protein